MDYYAVLGVEKTADEKTIKNAYRKLALKWHPDKNNESEEKKVKAEKMFQQISEAYACLSDPEKKRQHDLGGMSMDDMTEGGGMGGMGGMGGGFPGGF